MATKKKEAEPRSPRHDELVAFLLAKIKEQPQQALRVFFSTEDMPDPDSCKRFSVRTEHPCGYGFADICIEAVYRYVDIRVLIEVKTEHEAWSAGDVIRQLKAYSRDLRKPWDQKRQQVAIPLGFYCARPISDVERQLFQNEDVVLLS